VDNCWASQVALVKEYTCIAEDVGSVPGSGRSWRIPWTEEPGRL